MVGSRYNVHSPCVHLPSVRDVVLIRGEYPSNRQVCEKYVVNFKYVIRVLCILKTLIIR